MTLIIQTGTVSLWRLAGHVDTRAQTLSVHRRFERFFQYVRLDEGCVAQLIAHIMGLAGKRGILLWTVQTGNLAAAISIS